LVGGRSVGVSVGGGRGVGVTEGSGESVGRTSSGSSTIGWVIVGSGSSTSSTTGVPQDTKTRENRIDKRKIASRSFESLISLFIGTSRTSYVYSEKIYPDQLLPYQVHAGNLFPTVLTNVIDE
jgi:hypothetical protein